MKKVRCDCHFNEFNAIMKFNWYFILVCLLFSERICDDFLIYSIFIKIFQNTLLYFSLEFI